MLSRGSTGGRENPGEPGLTAADQRAAQAAIRAPPGGRRTPLRAEGGNGRRVR